MPDDGELPTPALPASNERPHVVYRGRVRTGCMTCRSRKIKCDQARPSCSRCIRSKRKCVYKPAASLHRNHGDGAKHSDGHGRNHHSPVASPGSVPSIPRLMETISSLSNRIYREDSTSTSLAELVSRDIQITTTMDLLAVSDDQSLHYFLEELHFPAISTYDPNNWKKIKDYLVQLAKTSKVVSLSIHALQHLHKTQTYGLPLTNSVLLYRAAKEALQGHIESEETSRECVVSAAFLIALFEMINYEVVSVLRQPSNSLVDMFRRWHESRHQFSPALIRMSIWLRLLNIAATRAGGPGLVSTNILGSLPVDFNDLSTVHPHTAANTELGGDGLFSFYYELEMVASELTTMAHYYRSRVTTSDQQEVAESIKELRQKMDRMWQTRPQLMKMTPVQLQNQLPHKDAQSTIHLVGVLTAAYYGQRIEIGRVLSYPLLSDPDVVEALAAVRDVVDGDWNAVQDGRVSCGYLRPLLLHAVESFDSEQTTWAVSHMKMIRDPIYRSDFYAAYAQGVSDMQILKDRRVTMRYYCLQAFGVDPPFL